MLHHAQGHNPPWDLFAYIEGYYNRQRLLSALGYITPNRPGCKPHSPVSVFSGEGRGAPS